MNQSLLDQLSEVTQEEQQILKGQNGIDRTLYMKESNNRVNAAKLLALGKLITLRSHTRFIEFPIHTHDYVEMVYMCSGRTKHIINGKEIELQTGELLLLNQYAEQKIDKAEKEDIAVNFIVLPEFFTDCLKNMGDEETPLRRFLVDCLCGKDSKAGYLHFQVSHVQPIQNLVENLIYTLKGSVANKQNISQLIMSVLFLELMNATDSLNDQENEEVAVVSVLRYIDQKYVDGSLQEIAEQLHYDLSWISRQVKSKTGKTYTELVHEKRMAQASFLLRHTKIRVDDISRAVGYENISYFHRLFQKTYGMTPKKFRDEKKFFTEN